MTMFFQTALIDALEDYRANLVIPEKLWHYTSSEGLLGIIQNHTLRFSDTTFVNDGSELEYGFKGFRRMADDYMQKLPQQEQNLVDQVVTETWNILSESGAVVFCMSEESNLLNQWRDYGADVVPYSIGLSVKEILQPEKFNFTTHLIKVIYAQKTQQELMSSLISKIYALAKSIEGFGTLSENDAKPYIRDAAMKLAYLILHFKNPAFDSEREWRLITHFPDVLEQEKPGYRTSILGVVPYFEWKRLGTNKLLPIAEVVVGPSRYGEISRQALNGFLAQNGYTSVETRLSLIPIRR